ncbi:acyl carrier protein [Rhodosalinus halophilus]|jgi:acyl carrier protein|uniref:Acyl carrier protein n=1 Tax=Rhodosalinus halophilus TaxID=2259333 RepID=A0A365UDZ0_9RHOB|nr:phosphopantetheine-binding protein [Rhodosalinus halophilus]RBI87497.1 acyl carrier protein [Rhodosalinus halophilus]
MTRDELQSLFIEELTRIAPDLEAGSVGAEDHLQDDLDLDSMDIVGLVASLHKRLGVEIPEADYRELETPSKAADYLARRLA